MAIRCVTVYRMPCHAVPCTLKAHQSGETILVLYNTIQPKSIQSNPFPSFSRTLTCRFGSIHRQTDRQTDQHHRLFICFIIIIIVHLSLSPSLILIPPKTSQSICFCNQTRLSFTVPRLLDLLRSSLSKPASSSIPAAAATASSRASATTNMAWRSSGNTNAELIENLYANGMIKSVRVKQAMKGVSTTSEPFPPNLFSFFPRCGKSWDMV